MRKITAAELHVIDVLAHAVVAHSIEKNVKGSNGFFEFYIKDALDARDQHIYASLEKQMKVAREELLKLLDEDIKNHAQ